MINGIVMVYTLEQLDLMYKIESRKRNESYQDYFENLPDVISILFLPDHMRKAIDGLIALGAIDLKYRKVFLHKRYGKGPNDYKRFAFYILEDIVKDKFDEYGYLNDDTIVEMLKKYKYIEE